MAAVRGVPGGCGGAAAGAQQVMAPGAPGPAAGYGLLPSPLLLACLGGGPEARSASPALVRPARPAHPVLAALRAPKAVWQAGLRVAV